MISIYSDDSSKQKHLYVFENFIAVEGVNKIAKQAALEFSKNNGEESVLVIRSIVGNGATHLAFAIFNEIEKQDINQELFYIGFERLMYHYLRLKQLDILSLEFLNTKSVIIIDSFFQTKDILFFNHLIDVLNQVQTKIIITTHAKNIKIPLNKKDIYLGIPSALEKEIIINHFLRNKNFYLSPAIIKNIANRKKLGVRETEGLITSFIAIEQLNNCKIDVKIINNLIFFKASKHKAYRIF